jgi:hypothetical protein
MNSRLKSVCGRLIDHPQGGLASLKDDDERITPLKKVMKDCLDFDREASLIREEIKSFVDSGEFRDRIEQISGLDPNRVKAPTTGFGVTIAVDVNGGQNAGDIMSELSASGLTFPGIQTVRLVPRQDEKLISILEHITKEDVIRANFNFAHSLDNERDKIRIQLGDGPQMDQLDKIIDEMLENGNAMFDVFSRVTLSDGSSAADCEAAREIGRASMTTNEEIFEELGLDI